MERELYHGTGICLAKKEVHIPFPNAPIEYRDIEFHTGRYLKANENQQKKECSVDEKL